MGDIDPHLWTRSHKNCKSPYMPCSAQIQMNPGFSSTHTRWACGLEEVVSYVGSSRYESETPLQEAERKLKEAQDQVEAGKRVVERLKKEARFGTQPSGGSIIKFEKTYGTVRGLKRYTYAALRVGDWWYTTGTEDSHPEKFTWEQLKDYIGNGKMWIPRNYEQAPDA